MQVAAVRPGVALAVRGLRAAVWTTTNSGKPVILVVEDEVFVRMMAVAIAEDGGFEALSAASADEAIGILESRSDVRLMLRQHARIDERGQARPRHFATAGPQSSCSSHQRSATLRRRTCPIGDAF
jgi:hypothetical protein